MEPFFSSQGNEEEPLGWAWALSPPLSPPPIASSFRGYKSPEPGLSPAASRDGPARNMQRKVIEYLRIIPFSKLGGLEEYKASRSFRQLMRERLRRGRVSQGYDELFSVLPRMSKVCNISMVQSSVAYLKEMKGAVERLLERNRELNAIVAAREGEKAKETNIRIQVPDPLHAMDSMIEAMRCLKVMGVKARAIRANLHGRDDWI